MGPAKKIASDVSVDSRTEPLGSGSATGPVAAGAVSRPASWLITLFVTTQALCGTADFPAVFAGGALFHCIHNSRMPAAQMPMLTNCAGVIPFQ